MRKYSCYSLLVLALMTSGFVHAQQPVMDSVAKKFRHFRGASFQEKLFIHVDQDFYLTGEILWFRVFSVDGTLHQVSDVSKVAFVEIIDQNNKPFVQTKVALDEHGGNGSLFLPATLSTGTYVIRAYTQWMRNFPSEHYFQKQITIVNPFIRPETILSSGKPKTNVEFFPEGGNLVAGVRSKVAFKITAADGRSASGSGAIVKNNGDTVSRFSPLKVGLGHFYLTPEPGAEYKCVFRDESGNQSMFALPKVFNEGYAMTLVDSNAHAISIRVTSRQENPSALRYAYLFVHSRQSIILAEAKPIHPSVAVFEISRDKLPEGISHFTVFDEAQRPVCERLYFKAPADPLGVTVSADQTSYATRRKVSLKIETMLKGSAVPADVSVSVYRSDSLSSENKDNILSYLYLESDLAGYIETPEYYFSGDAKAAAAADNLMLTQGWRRFNWDQVLSGKVQRKFIPEFRSHLVTGKVSKPDGSPAQGILTYLSSPGKLINLYGARSNKEGRVHFEVRDFWGSRRLIMQTNTNKDSTYTLTVDNPYDETPPTLKLSPVTLTPEMNEKLSSRSLSMQVQDIYYREANDKITAIKSDSTAFYGQPDETYHLDDFTRFPVMEEVMREYVPGVLVRKRRDGFHFMVLDRVNRGVLDGDPLALIDGMPVFDTDKIMAFDPLRIKKLEVVTRNFYVGPIAMSGIVSYYTYDGSLGGFQIDPRSVSINYEGLQLQREFYSPSYENQKLRNSRLPDQRSLLHWEPQLTTTNGAGRIAFYASDVTGDFIVVVHGLGSHGKAGTGICKFSVKRADF